MGMAEIAQGEESLTLKWGTLKGWSGLCDKSVAILRRYIAQGQSLSAMSQQDTPEQKQIICELIDAIDGEIWNDWNGTVMTKDEAKAYIREY
jgi:hypothetical protein